MTAFEATTTPRRTGGLLQLPLGTSSLRLGLNHAHTGGGFENGHASLAQLARGGVSIALSGGPFEIGAFATTPEFGSTSAPSLPVQGIRIGWNPDASGIGLGLGTLKESASAIGMTASGDFGGFQSHLTFAELHWRKTLQNWQWHAQAEFGWAKPAAAAGFVQSVSAVRTSAFSLSTQRQFSSGDILRLSLERPLRIDDGTAQLRVPTGRDKYRNVLYENIDASLAPGGRQFDLGADWIRPGRHEGSILRVAADLSLHPDHARGSDLELTLMAGYRLRF